MTTRIISGRVGMLARQISRRLSGYILSGLVAIMLATWIAPATGGEFSSSLQGDIGLGAYYARSIVRNSRDVLSMLPYADFDYGRLFARVDTLGVRTLPLGYGHLELIGRITQDGFETDTPGLRGLENRRNSLPLGIGTLQVTPIGGFWVNAFHDVRRSRGNWLEATYGGEFTLHRVTFYPLFGAEYQSGNYVRYYYGVSSLEAANSQYATYQPGGSLNDFAGLVADIGLTEGYHLNCYVRRKWLGDAIRSSPIVNRGYLDTGYIALSYRFK